ncbi:hypothetical protein Tco_0195097 [Tanacetum coccineum]
MLRACPHHGFTKLNQVDTFYNGLNENNQDSLNAAAGGNLLSKTTREALNIIENKSKVRYSRNKSNVSRMNTTSRECIDTFYNGLNDNDQDSLNVAAGENLLSKTTREALNIIENKSKVRYSRNKPNALRMNTTSRESVSKTDERIDKLADQLSTLVEIVSTKVVTPAPVKAGPSIPTNPSPKKVVERETKETTDKEQSNFQGSTAQIPPPVIPIPIPEPDVPKNLPKPNITYPSRLNQEKFCEKASYKKEKNFQMFQDLRFDISFADALFFYAKICSCD